MQSFSGPGFFSILKQVLFSLPFMKDFFLCIDFYAHFHTTLRIPQTCPVFLYQDNWFGYMQKHVLVPCVYIISEFSKNQSFEVYLCDQSVPWTRWGSHLVDHHMHYFINVHWVLPLTRHCYHKMGFMAKEKLSTTYFYFESLCCIRLLHLVRCWDVEMTSNAFKDENKVRYS